MSRAGARELFGTAQPPAPFRLLRAGPLEVRLENGNLRYVGYDGREVLRAISYVVRDRDWGTLAATIDDLKIAENSVFFAVSYTAVYSSGGANLSVRTRISGSDKGDLRFEAVACADAEFETNRCGFTILHPINGVAGAPVEVEHCDGTREETVFPELIEPWQPFKSIRALTHSPAPYLKACCRMEGDDFEMEDQRNWSDASYKTYVRPLALPWPYCVPAGEEQPQSVTLEIRETGTGRGGGDARAATASSSPIEIRPGQPLGVVLPRIGLLVSPQDVAGALAHLPLLKEIAPQALLCHFDPGASHGVDVLRRYRDLQTAFAAGYDLEYVVGCDGDLEEEFRTLASMLEDSGFVPGSLAVCPSVDRQSTPPGSTWPECPPLEDIYAAARKVFPRMTLGGGMFSYFTELNRKRPPVDLLDFVTHATNPIVHAADDDSVMETLETLPHITRSARAIIGRDKPYRLGPSTIGMRQNPYGSRTFANPQGERICMSHDDPRQRGLFAAAWTLGYAAAIAPAGIEQWVPASFTGPRGLVDETTGALLPVGETVARLARESGRAVGLCDTGGTGRVAALCFDDGGTGNVLVANLTPEDVEISCGETRVLGPYEIVRL